MFGYSIKKKSKKQEVIEAIMVLSPLLQEGIAATQEVRTLANDKIRDLIKEL